MTIDRNCCSGHSVHMGKSSIRWQKGGGSEHYDQWSGGVTGNYLDFWFDYINRLQIYISVHQYRYNKDWRYLSWHALYWRLQFTTFTNLFQHSLCLKIIIFSPTGCVAPPPQSPPPTRPECARPSLGSCVCGRSSSRTRIVGGTEASKGEFPWQVALTM